MKNANVKKVSRSSELVSTNLPWHKDPILKYTWITPLIILVPFFLVLSRHVTGRILRYLADNIIVILLFLILLPIAVITAIVMAVIVIRATQRENACSTQANGGHVGLWAFFCVLGGLAGAGLILSMVGQVSSPNNADEKSSESRTND